MKKLIFTLSFLTILGMFSFNSFSQVTVADSVSMEPTYAMDVYYSFNDGEVASVSRTNWDIAFHTVQFSATILTNGGNLVNLRAYPNSDTTGWNTIDTTGLSTWPILYDNEEYWEDGAFNRTGVNHPDYGWGKYNPVNHDVVGDSLFIIQLADGSFKKLWIVRKYSLLNIYKFRYANLDGSDEFTLELNANDYTSKNFVYFSFADGAFIDREPDTNTWDILFTKYIGIQPNGSPYPVIGALTNFGVYGNRFDGVEPGFMDWTSQELDSTRASIGWEWKSFDFSTGWQVTDSLAFFVDTYYEDIYKLEFTGYGGTGTGKIVFNKTLVSPASTGDIIQAGPIFRVSPNPVRGQVYITFNDEINNPVRADLYDISGRNVYSAESQVENGVMQLDLPVTALQTGLHVLVLRTGGKAYTSKVIIDRN